SWNLHLNMNLRGGAFRELESFFRFLESQVGRISLSGEQKLEWRLSSHLFSVKSLYSSLAGSVILPALANPLDSSLCRQ
ncbi:hypothetical protein LINPERPRIM_LOCUS23686, partial [Linum perenne]